MQRNRDTLYEFGSARVIEGINRKGRWKFHVSIDYNFERDYFKDYTENSFENISKLARYGVMVRANANKKGCDFNEEYWFTILK